MIAYAQIVGKKVFSQPLITPNCLVSVTKNELYVQPYLDLFLFCLIAFAVSLISNRLVVFD